MLGFFGGALTDIKLKSYGTAFLYSTGDCGNLPMKKIKILMHINIFNLHKKLLYFKTRKSIVKFPQK